MIKKKRLVCYTCEQHIFVQLKSGFTLIMMAIRPAVRRLILKGEDMNRHWPLNRGKESMLANCRLWIVVVMAHPTLYLMA